MEGTGKDSSDNLGQSIMYWDSLSQFYALSVEVAPKDVGVECILTKDRLVPVGTA